MTDYSLVKGVRKISGLRLGPPLPDEGPWQLMVFKSRTFALSQESGLYELEATSLRKIELDQIVETPLVKTPSGRKL